MTLLRSALALAIAAASAVSASAQFGGGQRVAQPTDSASGGATTAAGVATEQTQKFRVGAVVKAKRGACADILAVFATPIECDEQSVRLLSEDVSPEVERYEFRDVAGGEARQVVVTIPFLPAGAEARVVLTYEVTTRTTAPPSDAEAAAYAIPRRPPRDLKRYTGPSPFIETNHKRIKRLARSIASDLEESSGGEPTDWEKLAAAYDHVMETIEYAEGPDTSALTTLKDEYADCHGRSALFIALARNLGAPARMVWVHNHVYPEFYLEDAEGEGRWFPAESAGTIAFGGMPVARTILQKGDNFRMPERKAERLRYATDYLTGRPAARGAGKPSVAYLREVVVN